MATCDNSEWSSTRFRIYNVFKNFLSGERIQKVADSSAAGFTGYVWTEAGSAKKRCGFKSISIRADGGLISKIVISSSDRRVFTHRVSHIPLTWLSVLSYAECHDLLDPCAIPLALIPKIWTKDFFFFLRWFECISYSWQREGVLRFSVVFEVRDH